jgi:hypothetical protein
MLLSQQQVTGENDCTPSSEHCLRLRIAAMLALCCTETAVNCEARHVGVKCVMLAAGGVNEGLVAALVTTKLAQGSSKSLRFESNKHAVQIE